MCLIVLREITVCRIALDGSDEAMLGAVWTRPQEAINVSSPCISRAMQWTIAILGYEHEDVG